MEEPNLPLEKRILNMWANPLFSGSFKSISTFFNALRALPNFQNVPYSAVKTALEHNAEYIHQPGIWQNHFATRKLNFDEPKFNANQKIFENNPIEGGGIEFQADLFEMPQDKRHHYIFLLVDEFNKFVYTKALTNKSGRQVAQTLMEIKEKNKLDKFMSLTTDKGTEFTSAVKIVTSKNWPLKHFIFTKSKNKAFLAEEQGQNLKRQLEHFSKEYRTKKWVDVLPQITRNINASKTKSLASHFASAQVNDSIFDPFVRKIKQQMMKDPANQKKIISNDEFHIGDYCFVHFPEKTFTKAYKAKRGQIYQIYKIDDFQKPYKYYVEDLLGQKVSRIFYNWQLKKFPGDIATYNFPIDKILGQKNVNGQKMYKIRYKIQ